MLNQCLFGSKDSYSNYHVDILYYVISILEVLPPTPLKKKEKKGGRGYTAKHGQYEHLAMLTNLVVVQIRQVELPKILAC